MLNRRSSLCGSGRRASRVAIVVALSALLIGIALAAAQTRPPPAEVAFPDSSGKLRLTGQLYRPEKAGTLPAVILLHGCDGIGPLLHRWAQTLRHWGYVGLILDSLGPRRVTDADACRKLPDPFASPQHVRMPDAYAAKRFLETRSFVDRNRIAIMGWGLGGWAVLYAIDEVYLTEISTPPFRAAIAVYPWCAPGFRLLMLNAPLLVLIGEADDWAVLCENMVGRLERDETASPHEVALKVYPGAPNRFDDLEPESPYLNSAEKAVRRFLAQHLSTDPSAGRR